MIWSYFFDHSRDVSVATNFVDKIDPQSTPCIISEHHIQQFHERRVCETLDRHWTCLNEILKVCYSIRKPVVANFMILQSFKIRQACICDKRFALVWVTELGNVSDSGDTLHCVPWCDMCMHYGRWYTVTQAKFASQHSFLCKRSIMAKSSKITIYLIKIVQLPETSFLGTSDPKPALRVLLNFWAICASGSGDEILKAFYQVSLSSFLGR